MTPEEPHIDLSEEGISRRRMLKRIGAGAAVAWSAPVLTSLRTPAFAQASPTCTSPCAACFDSSAAECGTDPVRGGVCLCSASIEGDCVCGSDDTCDEWGLCKSSSDCAPDFVCKPVACHDCSSDLMNCQRPCGHPLPGGASKRVTGRRMSG